MEAHRSYDSLSGLGEPTIIGGNETSNPAFIENAYKILINGSPTCSGFEYPTPGLNKVIATAAHCVDDLQSSYSIQGPGKNINEGKIIPAMPVFLRRVDPLQPHPDIALLITDELATSELPYTLATEILKSGDSITVVGFGYTSVDANSLSDNLKEAQETVWSIGPTNEAECGKLELKEFCALPEDGNACNGDSGGGVFTTASDGQLNLNGLIVQVSGGCTVVAAEDWSKWKSHADLCATDPEGSPTYCTIPPDCIEGATSQQAVIVDTTDTRLEIYLPSVSSKVDGTPCINAVAMTGISENLPAAQEVSPLFALAILGIAIGQGIKNRFNK